MSEITTSAVSETPNVNSTNESHQEGHIQETKAFETSSAIVEANDRITEHINNGLLPEQIDNRLESELQRPEVQRHLVDEFSPYSETINPFIKTTKELSVYTGIGLQESKILDRPCLQAKIDPNATDAMGRTNMERMAGGRPPMDENGDPVNLHHIGQKVHSPLAELPDRIHKECDGVLHDKTIPTEVHGEGNNWNGERAQYWRERGNTL